MANTSSAKKAIRNSKRKKSVNDEIRKLVKESKKAITKLLDAGNVKEAESLLPKYQSKVDMAAKKNTIKKNTAARRKSRMVERIIRIKTKK